MPTDVEVEGVHQCRKWRRPVKTIAAPAAETALDDLGVALRAAGLNERRDPGVERELRPVREREERVRGEDRALERVPELARLLDRDANRIHPTRLAAPIPMVWPPRASTIAFEVTCFTTRQAKSRSSHCSSETSPHTTSSPHALQSLDRDPGRAGRRDAPVVTLVLGGRALLGVLEDAQRRLASEAAPTRGVVRGREQHLDELATSASASAAVTARFTTTTPPYADTGSAASAFA